ncbi:hypothetical protein R1sor_020459 [Riccia sorocarpa]|uniref:Uncharacterized protein n=1 Tax=Riccia sorocarpa TaxID=122646 RepID=A0ABD3IFM4_9MARC
MQMAVAAHYPAGLFSFATADITFVSDVADARLFVTCTTSSETVDLVDEGDTAVFPQSNGGGVKCIVNVEASGCAQALQADLDPSSGRVDAQGSYTWTISRAGISLDDQNIVYEWAPGCFWKNSALPMY